MGLDVFLKGKNPEAGATSPYVYTADITHNLGKMAGEAGIYKHLWCPEEIGVTRASELIDPLTHGLERLRAEPERFKAFNPQNGWGTYEGLVRFTEDYLLACKAFPTAEVSVWTGLQAMTSNPNLLSAEVTAWYFIDNHEVSPSLHGALTDLVRRARIDGAAHAPRSVTGASETVENDPADHHDVQPLEGILTNGEAVLPEPRQHCSSMEAGQITETISVSSEATDFDDPEPLDIDALLKGGWVYRDTPGKFSFEIWDKFLSLIGEENYRILAMSEGDDWKRGQLLISPDGLARLQEIKSVAEPIN